MSAFSALYSSPSKHIIAVMLHSLRDRNKLNKKYITAIKERLKEDWCKIMVSEYQLKKCGCKF